MQTPKTRFEEVVVTANPVAPFVKVEAAGRGAWATVVEGKFEGLEVFASTPATALGVLMRKVEEASR